MEEIRTDVLVLGGGLAGTLATLSARDEGARVVNVFMDPPGKSGNSARAGGVLAALSDDIGLPEDSPEAFAADTYRSGCFLSDPEMIRTLIEGSENLITELKKLGVSFLEKDDRLAATKAPGHTYPRAVRVPGGGPMMMATITSHTDESGVTTLPQTALLQLLKDENGHSVGADLIRLSTGKPVRVLARATILAMGGLGGLYPTTTNAPGISGEGYAAALEAGCRLREMEFIQFTPTALAWPPTIKGKNTGGIALTFPEARITNADGERFMARYAPEALERAKRDILARAMHREIVEGRGSPHGGVFLDLTHVPEAALRDVIGEIMNEFSEHGVDMTSQHIELSPAAHSCMGGVAIDSDGFTGVKNLFAAGENAGGLHGANRLGGGGLTIAGIMGLHTGRAAAAITTENGRPTQPFPSLREPTRKFEQKITLAEEEIKKIMFEAGGIERNAITIRRGIQSLGYMKEILDTAEPSSGLSLRLARLKRMRLTAHSMLTAMSLREESRGAHQRVDYPERNDDKWLANIFLSLGEGEEIRTEKTPIPNQVKTMVEKKSNDAPVY